MAPTKVSSSAAASSSVSSAPTKAAPTPTPVAAPVVDENIVVESEVDKYDVVIEKLQTMVNDMKDMIAVVKTLKKENAKVAKAKGRRQSKAKNEDGTKRPASGITKPTKLTDELCDFLGVARGTSLARTEVTKIINNYIKTNKLQDETDKRTIHPDAKLKKILLPIPSDKKLSFFNMQSFIKHQFVKA